MYLTSTHIIPSIHVYRSNSYEATRPGNPDCMAKSCCQASLPLIHVYSKWDWVPLVGVTGTARTQE